MSLQCLSRSYLHCSAAFFRASKLRSLYNEGFNQWNEWRENSFIFKKIEGCAQAGLSALIGAPLGFIAGNLLQRLGESGYKYLGGITGAVVGAGIVGVVFKTKALVYTLAAIESVLSLIKNIFAEWSELCRCLYDIADNLLKSENFRFWSHVPFIAVSAWFGPAIFGAIFDGFLSYDAEDQVTAKQIGMENGAWLGAIVGYLIAEPSSKLAANIIATVTGGLASIFLIPHSVMVGINYCVTKNNPEEQEAMLNRPLHPSQSYYCPN